MHVNIILFFAYAQFELHSLFMHTVTQSHGNTRAHYMSELCWLCIYSTDEIAHSINSLIHDNIHCMHIDVIAKQASLVLAQQIVKQYGNEGSLNGADEAAVKVHIKDHMLHANVALAVTLKDLLQLSRDISGALFVTDEESGHRSLDITQFKNYTMVINQITAIYKLGDGNKLLFSRVHESK